MQNNPFRSIQPSRNFAEKMSLGCDADNRVIIIESDMSCGGRGFFVEREGGLVRPFERVVARYENGRDLLAWRRPGAEGGGR